MRVQGYGRRISRRARALRRSPPGTELLLTGLAAEGFFPAKSRELCNGTVPSRCSSSPGAGGRSSEAELAAISEW
jgi:hypothetical protein